MRQTRIPALLIESVSKAAGEKLSSFRRLGRGSRRGSIRTMSLSDPSTLLRSRAARAASPDFGHDVRVEPDGTVVGRFLQSRLVSVFEPVLALEGGAPVGAQSQVRTFAADGAGLAPWALFANAATAADLVRLDRLARVVHALSFYARSETDRELHLSVHPRLVDAVPEHHGAAFRRLLDAVGLGAARVVIELPGIAPGDEGRIVPVAASYVRHGFGIAFRPVGRRQLETLLAHTPLDTLRIDADRLLRLGSVDATLRAAARRGIRTVIEGVRSATDIEHAREAGASHVQGPVFGAPRAEPDLDTPLEARVGVALSASERSAVRRLRTQWVA